MRFFAVMLIAKSVRALIRLIDKQRGTDFPGRIALKLYPNFNLNFKNINHDKGIIVTGSNGKSTVTNMLYHSIKECGCTAAANLAGSNMINGAVSMFIENCTIFGKLKTDYYIIEADERSFPLIYKAFPAKNILITNIMQDQVHRNGEPDFIYQILKKTINKNMRVFVNNDEPRSASFAEYAGEAVYFGADKFAEAFYKNGFTDVTLPCPICSSKIEFEFLNLSNTGRFKCSGCGFASESLSKDFVIAASDTDFENGNCTVKGTSCVIPYNMPSMVYNLSAVLAVCDSLGLNIEKAAEGMKNFINVAGRAETIKYKDKTIKYIRMKQENPETLQDALNAAALDKTPKIIALGLCTLKERRPEWQPHYTNTYYAYESDFKPLLNSGAEKIICFSEYVCYDIVNRLKYEGVDQDKLEIIDSDKAEDVFAAIDKCVCRNVYIITLMSKMNEFKKYIYKNKAKKVKNEPNKSFMGLSRYL